MVAVAMLGLADTDAESMLDVHKLRVGSLAKILSAALIRGAQEYNEKYKSTVQELPGIFTDSKYATQFARLASLVMSRQAMDGSTFSRNVPAGEPQRLQREIDMLLRWFRAEQGGGHKVASWLVM